MRQRTRIKICGITRLEDALDAAALGADSIGLVFHRPSPRSIELEDARKIMKALPPFITVTALLMDESQDWIDQVIENLNPDCLQFHGNETPEACRQWNTPFLKAIPMGSVTDAKAYAAQYADAQGFLLDSHAAGQQGGTGGIFDWHAIPNSFNLPLILAGGITPANVADAISQVNPWAVDVSTGVEVSKGIKDKALLARFFAEVKRADASTG